MTDRPLTLVLIAVSVLVALYIRRTGKVVELVTPEQAKAEGARRGVKVDISGPMTRGMFEELIR